MVTSTKVAKTRIGVNSDLPTTNDLDATTGWPSIATPFTFPDECNITNIQMFQLSYDSSTDEATFCDIAANLTAEDLDDLKASSLTIEGYYNKGDAMQAYLDAKFLTQEAFAIKIEDPNGTDFVWVQVKLKTRGKTYGVPNDKLKFSYEFILRDMPVAN